MAPRYIFDVLPTPVATAIPCLAGVRYNEGMAEEKSTSSNKVSGDDLLLAVLAILLVGQMVQRIPALLEEKLGIDVGGVSEELGLGSQSLSPDTPLGTAVSAPRGAPFYDVPDGKETGSFGVGETLTLVGGPKIIGVDSWWEAESQTGRGWVESDGLVREGWGGLSGDTPLSTHVRAAFDADVYRTPGGGAIAGTLARGARATLEGGPRSEGGGTWWLLAAEEDDVRGWAPEGALELAAGKAFVEGAAIETVQDADLFERPGGGRTLGFLREGEAGEVRGGPESSGGTFWWLIRAEDGTEGWVAEDALKSGGVAGGIRTAWRVFIIVSSIVSVLLLVGVLYFTFRANQIRAHEARRIREAIPRDVKPKRNERWDQILANVSSQNPNDWRLAIIEADIMLDELLSRAGYQGASLGDKLKSVSRGDLASLDAAWEAHKVRNQIAHAGSDYILTQREARKVIELYGTTFSELKVI